MKQQPPFLTLEWDDNLEELDESKTTLVASFAAAELWLYTHAHSVDLSRDLVCDLHRQLFANLFPLLSGRIRHAAVGFDQPVTFGGMQGIHFRDLPDQLETWNRLVRGYISDLDRFFDEQSPTQHAEEVMKVAAFTYCELTRLHPFVNGNGRTARLCVNNFAYRYGLQPLIVERDREDPTYIAAANDWLQYGIQDSFIGYLRQRMVPGTETRA